jgi:hypothetical protein
MLASIKNTDRFELDKEITMLHIGITGREPSSLLNHGQNLPRPSIYLSCW